jgi:uncharacterized protein (TIGR04255 family)
MTDAIFPDSPRVVFARTPLKSVTCELRFPALLKIEAETPVAFQEMVRAKFPLFSRRKNTVIGDIPKEILAAIGEIQSGLSYVFTTADSTSSITLGSGSVSVSTTLYTRWEDFSVDLMQTIGALTEIYAPSFFSRIGLRYMNAIQRSELGLSDMPGRNSEARDCR